MKIWNKIKNFFKEDIEKDAEKICWALHIRQCESLKDTGFKHGKIQIDNEEEVDYEEFKKRYEKKYGDWRDVTYDDADVDFEFIDNTKGVKK